jgi:hypothetical protein
LNEGIGYEWIDEWMNAHEFLCQVLRMVFHQCWLVMEF